MTRRIVLLCLALATVCVVVTVCAHYFFVVIPAKNVETAKLVAKDFADIFNFTPKVTIGNTTIVGEAAAILELSTAQREFQHEIEWKHSWFGSEKIVTIKGTCVAKAGFDLRNSLFSLDFQPGM